MPAASIWHCLACGSDWPEPVPHCPRPGCWSLRIVQQAPSRWGIARGQPGYKPTAPQYRSMSAGDLLRGKRGAPRFGWGYEALQLPAACSVTVLGKPGTMKSSFATMVAFSLASQGVRVLYGSIEEGLSSDTLRERVRRCLRWLGVSDDRAPEGVTLVEAATVEAMDRAIRDWGPSRDGLVVLDSATHLRAPVWWLDGLCHARHGLLAVLHQTTQGMPRGGLEPLYAADVVLRTRQGSDGPVAEVEKSRYGQAAIDIPLLQPRRFETPDAAGTVIPLRREAP